MSKGIADAVVHAWLTTPNGKGQDLSEIVGAPAFAIRGMKQECIVAVPMDCEREINEEFSSVKLVSVKKSFNGVVRTLLMLMYDGVVPPRSFAALSAEFLYPGEHGEFRDALLENPSTWWREWKELLGNENVELRVYDVLGELCVLRILSEKHPEVPYAWHGPQGATFDIHAPNDLFEVKSTVVKGDKRIVVHNAFQLDARGVPLHLMFCVFEASNAGESINDLVEDLTAKGILDFDRAEEYLKGLGFAKGRSIRDKKYLLLSVSQYEVDDRFPIINPLPTGVVDLEYTVELGAFSCVKVF